MKKVYFGICFCLFSSSLQGMYFEGPSDPKIMTRARLLAAKMKTNPQFQTQAGDNDGDCSHLTFFLGKIL